jgi:hypothetical protein
MEIKTTVNFKLPDGTFKEFSLNIIPRKGDIVTFGKKEYIIKYIDHDISEDIPDRFEPVKVLTLAVTTHIITIVLEQE